MGTSVSPWAEAADHMPVHMRSADASDTLLYTLAGAWPPDPGTWRRYTGALDLPVGTWKAGTYIRSHFRST
jgi:hypothetical protein